MKNANPRLLIVAAAIAFAWPALAAPEPISAESSAVEPPGPPIALAPSADPEAPRPEPAAPPTITAQPFGFAAKVLEALETTAPLSAGNAGEPIAASVRLFYEGRGFRPIWTDGKGSLPKAQGLLNAVKAVYEDGLEPSDYITPGVQALFTARDEDSLARLEAELTWAMVRVASDLKSGRTVPNEVDPELFVHPHNINPAVVLSQAAAVNDIEQLVARHAPQGADYKNLKAALKRYREIARLGGWTEMSDGRILRPGYRDHRVQDLKRVLAERGEAVTADNNHYDAALIDAVRAFQRRHGLGADGAFGPQTLGELNTSVERRIEQIKINMERWRWMPANLGQRYAMVNLADYRLEVVFDGEPVYESRVVIGTNVDRTPVFSDVMTYMVINPYWNIPPSIARDEMLPQLRKDPYALARRGIRVFSSWGSGASEIDPGMIDWNMVSRAGFPFKLRQDPGNGNALGRVKFMFPNQFNIYLHDTPSKSLFNRTVRAFSHGCIRVEEPFRLAKLLLRDDPRWSEERFDRELASRQRRVISLPTPINVHLTYLTAWVDADGIVHFRDDIYGRDKRLTAALDASRQTPMAPPPLTSDSR